MSSIMDNVQSEKRGREEVHRGDFQAGAFLSSAIENPTKTAYYVVKINHPPLVPFECLSQPSFSRVFVP